MTLPTSGPLTFSDIQTEFGGTNPIALNEYYAGGTYVPAATSGTYGAVPSSGQIGVQNFYGTSAVIPAYIEEVFQTWVYTGNGATQTITNGLNLSANGGLVWTKARYYGISHRLVDTARGPYYELVSNDTSASSYNGQGLTSFGTTGYSIDAGGGYNNSGGTYVSWTFQEKPKFFDIVTYTGTGVARTIAHNLGSVPGCIIVKRTDSPGGVWYVYHQGNTSGGSAQSQELRLNGSNATNTNTDIWDNTAPTSSVFSIGVGASPSAWNASGGTYVAYIFAHNAGGFGATGTDNVISCGSFTTDGSGNASVTLGYEPQWLMTKTSSTASSGSWYMQDNMRGWVSSDPGGNPNKLLYANLADAEVGGGFASLNATGFTFASGGYGPWANATFVYIAIRRGPMKVPTVGTTVFSPIARTGTGSVANVSVGFPPDFLTTFYRVDAGQDHVEFDRLRGPTQYLNTAATTQEIDVSTNGLISFNNTTFTTNANGYANNLDSPFSNWVFGRAPSFFDIVCYTGTGANRTVTHNLGVVPELMIVKSRSAAGNQWAVYAAPSGNTNVIYLNKTDATSSNQYVWNNTTPTSTVFTVSIAGAVNTSAATYVAYLFATCAGVSKVGSYTGNGTTQTINCGFTGGARFVLIKRTDSTSDWYVYDTARGMTTLTDPYLLINNQAAEVATLGSVTTVSTGFALNAAILAAINTSAASYIFLAVA